MTITYDPDDPPYLDEADVRGELTRVFDVCHECRRCTELCTAFPSMFEFIDRHESRDAGLLTPAQQDAVVDECVHCKLCHVNCPYTPEQHELAIDFPRLMLRTVAMRRATKQTGVRHRATTAMAARSGLSARLAVASAPVANRVVAAPPGSLVRKGLQAVTGISAQRLLAPYVRQRFTTWFRNRPTLRIERRQGRVAVFPTCLVEYQNPPVGHALVHVYERNGIECTVTEGAGCCGAPFLHSGELDRFRALAERNVAALAAAVRAGHDVVVPQPTCGYVVKQDYTRHVGGEDASLVAQRTFDAAEYLMRLHQSAGGSLDTEFTGDVPRTITYHTPCHLRAQEVGLRSRDLLKLTGARVTLVQQCSGIGPMWGLRAEHAALSLAIAERLGDAVERAGGEVVAGDCHLANTAITEQTGRRPLHPLEVLARAYGIAPEEPRR